MVRSINVRDMVVDSIDESSNITSLIRTYDETFRSVGSSEKSHHAVPIIMLAMFQEVDISNILCDDCQISNASICFHSESISIRKQKQLGIAALPKKHKMSMKHGRIPTLHVDQKQP